jgi:hypothetical protein
MHNRIIMENRYIYSMVMILGGTSGKQTRIWK